MVFVPPVPLVPWFLFLRIRNDHGTRRIRRTRRTRGTKLNTDRFTDLVPDNPLEIQENIPLAPLTTLKIGGPARFFVKAESEQQVVEAFEYAKNEGLDLFVLGGGSNILVSDAGFDGLVLRVAMRGISVGNANGDERVDDAIYHPAADAAPLLIKEGSFSGTPPNHFVSARRIITAQAGEDWDDFVNYCVGSGLAGIECLSGIPGYVGGTPVQNVGAYGQEVSETIVSVRCLDRSSGVIVDLTNAECGFEYRTSIFNTSMRDRFIVLSVTYSLIDGGGPKIVYKDLKDLFAGRQPTLSETREAVLRIRAAKSMVMDANDPNSRSAGSFFKNPIVGREKLGEIGDKLGIANVPHFDVDLGRVKIPAAWLIENAGFYKGFKMGNAGISTRHSLAIVNRGNASAKDVVALKDEIVSAVKAKFGIELRPEPIFVGFR